MRQRQASPTQDIPQALSLQRLFLTFLKLGATAFGGPAMLAYMRTVVVEQQHWLAEEPFRAQVDLLWVVVIGTALSVVVF